MATQIGHQLLIRRGDSQPQALILPQGETLIGSDPAAAAHLLAPEVSDHHARLECDATSCHLTDLGSDAGTWMGRRKLEAGKRIKLGPGAIFRVGPYELTYRQLQDPPQRQSPPQPEQKSENKSEAKPKARSPQKKPADGPAKESAPSTPSPPRNPPPNIPSLPPSSVHPVDPGKPPPGLGLRSIKLIDYLPGIYRTDFMERFLAVFEAILLPIEGTVDNFDLFLDPSTTPSGFLPWLAGWFDILFDETWDDSQRRTLLAEANQIYARRGTKYALSRLLEIYTGHKPEIIDIGDDQPPDTFIVRLPGPSTQYYWMGIDKIIEAAKPAHTRYTLSYLDY